MLNKPVYDEIIIVGIIFNNKFNWYIANKELWILDLTKLSKNNFENYFKTPINKQIRENIITLSDDNAKLFLDRLQVFKVDNIDQLRLNILDEIKNPNSEGLEDYYPTLMINFDEKILYSQFPEPFAYEKYIPNDWIGKYDSFIDYIELKNKYWIYKDKNLLLQ